MNLYQTIELSKTQSALSFSNGVVTLLFDPQTGNLADLRLYGQSLCPRVCESAEVVLTLDGQYDAAKVSNRGGLFAHPRDAQIVDGYALTDCRLERGVAEVTLALDCLSDAGLLTKYYTLRSEGETGVVSRRFTLRCSRSLRLDEAELTLPSLCLPLVEAVGSPDARMLRGEAGAVLLWAEAYRDECSTVETRDGVLSHRVYRCAAAESGETIRFGEDSFAIADAAHWMETIDCAARGHARAGLICENPMRREFARMAIYEAMIGVWRTRRQDITRYAHVSDLVADLPRIAGMGFNVVQLMPSLPFPSYTVQDLTDLCLQNGNGEDMRPLVEALHRRGMRLIIDIVLHGVYDAEGMRLKGGGLPGTRFPETHPYRSQHPDWFLVGDDGAMVRTYTWSFDHASEGWQDYVCEALAGYVRDFDVDGFRFDALEWSQTPDCAVSKPHDGGAHLRRGNYDLYRKLRERLDPIKPDILWMDENPHVYLTDLMYAAYSGDTPFQLEKIRQGESNARALQSDLAKRARLFPVGFSFVQYGENHDIVQAKDGVYLTEAHGAAYARLMMAFGAMAGGPFMCFMGGELGYEEFITRLIALRERFTPLFQEARADFEAAVCDDSSVACIYREAKGRALLGVFNTGKSTLETVVRLRGESGAQSWRHVWSDETYALNALCLPGESFLLLTR